MRGISMKSGIKDRREKVRESEYEEGGGIVREKSSPPSTEMDGVKVWVLGRIMLDVARAE